MSEAPDFSLFTVAGLAHRCRQETNLFYKRLEYNELFCFELFRRAIQDQNEHAWNLLVEQYRYQVAAWIKRHELFAAADENIDYFLNKAFINFWRAFNNDKDKLEKFTSLKGLMRYLQLCAHTAVKEYVERQMNPNVISIPEDFKLKADNSANPEKTVEMNKYADYIWQCVLERVNSEQERKIAEAYLIYDMKPREIFAAYTDVFTSVDQVRRIKDNFLTRLRRDKQLLDVLR